MFKSIEGGSNCELSEQFCYFAEHTVSVVRAGIFEVGFVNICGSGELSCSYKHVNICRLLKDGV